MAVKMFDGLSKVNMKALVIGATGLVGKAITKELLLNESVAEIHLFVRRPSGLEHPKLMETVIDFDNIDSFKDHLKGDILFSSLGTTLKVAGSKEAQFKVDHDYQFEVAKTAALNGVRTYVLISSVNANAKSSFFYLRMKGQLEDKAIGLPFASINILRPGPLKGHRENSRLNELISTRLLELLPKFLVIDSVRPVAGERVASIAVKTGLSARKGIHIIGPDVIR